MDLIVESLQISDFETHERSFQVGQSIEALHKPLSLLSLHQKDRAAFSYHRTLSGIADTIETSQG